MTGVTVIGLGIPVLEAEFIRVAADTFNDTLGFLPPFRFGDFLDCLFDICDLGIVFQETRA
jgi:hypothetical protein